MGKLPLTTVSVCTAVADLLSKSTAVLYRRVSVLSQATARMQQQSSFMCVACVLHQVHDGGKVCTCCTVMCIAALCLLSTLAAG